MFPSIEDLQSIAYQSDELRALLLALETSFSRKNKKTLKASDLNNP